MPEGCLSIWMIGQSKQPILWVNLKRIGKAPSRVIYSIITHTLLNLSNQLIFVPSSTINNFGKMNSWLLAASIVLLVAAAASPTFRSYHPHYLHSYSYPQPSTLHMYYGRVMNNQPVFLIQQGDQATESELFTVGKEPVIIDPVRNKIRRQMMRAPRQLECMLVFSIEDSTGSDRVEAARLEVGLTSNTYIVVMVNGTESKAYSVQATKSNIILSVDEYASNNISVAFRNVSDNPKHNWRLSRNITFSKRTFF